MMHILVDVLPAQKGKPVADAMSCFAKVRPVIERNSLTRLNDPLEAYKALRGAQSASSVNVSETKDPQNASIILTSRLIRMPNPNSSPRSFAPGRGDNHV